MALVDVKKYYFTTVAQLVEMKEDLADFEQALKDGHITEDRLAEVRENITAVEQNVNRLTYIMYLLELPKKARSIEKYKKQTKKITDWLSFVKADDFAVIAENKSALDFVRMELKKLKPALDTDMVKSDIERLADTLK